MFIAITAALICIVVLVCIILPPSLGTTQPFLDNAGNVMEGSISEKAYVEINGTSLGMFIMAKDYNNPVLLILGGGPGIPEYLLEYYYPTGLENKFVVCYLEYRGTSLSYSADISSSTMTTEQYIADVVGITIYLSERFGQKKIYLMGHSFGTYVGLLAASQYPELYHAYIAMAQITDSLASEKLAYTYMLEQYEAAGNTKMVEKLEGYPILTADEAYREYTTSSVRDTAMHELGVGTMHNMDSVITGIFFPSLRCKVYTPYQRINIWRGKTFPQTTSVAVDARQFNSFEKVASLEIPIYFFAGKFDYTCNYDMQKAYYNQVAAPLKGFYTFENSAHSPLFEEPGQALLILVEDVLTGTNSLSE